MCALRRLSFVSAVCVPVKSMLKMVAVNVIAVIAVFSTKSAVPNEAGRGAPVIVVGTVGGTSAASLRLACKIVSARAAVLAASIVMAIAKAGKKRFISISNSLDGGSGRMTILHRYNRVLRGTIPKLT